VFIFGMLAPFACLFEFRDFCIDDFLSFGVVCVDAYFSR
jgi:hypothetical protein